MRPKLIQSSAKPTFRRPWLIHPRPKPHRSSRGTCARAERLRDSLRKAHRPPRLRSCLCRRHILPRRAAGRRRGTWRGPPGPGARQGDMLGSILAIPDTRNFHLLPCRERSLTITCLLVLFLFIFFFFFLFPPQFLCLSSLHTVPLLYLSLYFSIHPSLTQIHTNTHPF